MGRRLFLAAAFAFVSAPVPAQPLRTPEAFKRLEWRNVGPLNPTGRVAEVQGVPGDPRVVWVGAASGGVWKSEDGGLSFRPVFDDQDVHSIGSIAVAPSNPDVVYVGTGEGNPRNSVSPGGGVFKTTDGGKTWSFLGLQETRHVTRLLVHPSNPDVAYVGALGHAFGPNAERGVFRTSDGGQSWQKVLFLDDKHGVADLDMSPQNPNLLFAALWRFERKPWTHTSGSEQTGVWRSIDGGRTWSKQAKGLPKLMGRIGVKVAPSDPKVVYVICESNEGTLYRSDDGGDSFRKVTDRREIVSRGLYYTDLRVHPQNPDVVFAVSSLLQKSIDGGKTWERISPTTHIDFHALWIDPLDPNRMWQGQDGGVAVSYDAGKKWEPVRNLPLAQAYQGYADNREPFYSLGVGLQDNGTWYGPSRTREPAGILEDDWRMPSFGDAFFIVAHPRDPDLLLSESQGGSLFKTDIRTRQQRSVSPQAERNDGGPAGAMRHRFNWNSPVVPSPHDADTVYFAGNVVFRSKDFGDTWEAISPDLTTNDPDKIKDAGGPVWKENTTAEYHCTVISFAESAAQAGVLWAGTDDGNLQLSRDGGRTWTNLAVPGVPKHSPVSHVEPSRTEAGTAWVAFDRHLFDDYGAYLFKTTDFGKTFTRADSGIAPEAYVHVVRQDPKNARLLWAGTERGLYASWDEGRSWLRTHLKNLPSVPVHDVFFQVRENDLILATHGRAMWVLDDATPLQQLDPKAPPQSGLFAVRPGLRFPARFTRYGIGDKTFRAPNPPSGALISYSLAEDMGDKTEDADAKDAAPKKERVKLEIVDGSGRVIRTIRRPPAEKGVDRVAWDLRLDPPRPRKEGQAPEAGEFAPPPAGPAALPGRYTVRLTVDGKPLETPVEVRIDPLVKTTEAGLRAQHEMAAALVGWMTATNDLLRGLDGLQVQLEERQKSLRALGRELPADAKPAWEAADAERKRLLDRLARGENIPFWSEGPRLSDRLSGLFATVEQAFAAPTSSQQEYFQRLRGQVEDAKAAYASLLSGPVTKLNEALGRNGLPALMASSGQ